LSCNTVRKYIASFRKFSNFLQTQYNLTHEEVGLQDKLREAELKIGILSTGINRKIAVELSRKKIDEIADAIDENHLIFLENFIEFKEKLKAKIMSGVNLSPRDMTQITRICISGIICAFARPSVAEGITKKEYQDKLAGVILVQNHKTQQFGSYRLCLPTEDYFWIDTYLFSCRKK